MHPRDAGDEVEAGSAVRERQGGGVVEVGDRAIRGLLVRIELCPVDPCHGQSRDGRPHHLRRIVAEPRRAEVEASKRLPLAVAGTAARDANCCCCCCCRFCCCCCPEGRAVEIGQGLARRLVEVNGQVRPRHIHQVRVVVVLLVEVPGRKGIVPA